MASSDAGSLRSLGADGHDSEDLDPELERPGRDLQDPVDKLLELSAEVVFRISPDDLTLLLDLVRPSGFASIEFSDRA